MPDWTDMEYEWRGECQDCGNPNATVTVDGEPYAWGKGDSPAGECPNCGDCIFIVTELPENHPANM